MDQNEKPFLKINGYHINPKEITHTQEEDHANIGKGLCTHIFFSCTDNNRGAQGQPALWLYGEERLAFLEWFDNQSKDLMKERKAAA